MPFNISTKLTSFAAMEAKKIVQRDWSSLFPEILNLIAKNLSEVSDFIRFRAVCKAWRSSTPITDLPPQFPWIIVHDPNKSDLDCYSILSNKLYTIHSPKSFSFLRGQVEGYVLAVLRYRVGNFDTNQLSLLNPLNNHEIPLPDIDFNHRFPMFYPWKNQMGEYVVRYVDGSSFCKFGFWQLGQNNWCKLNLALGYIAGKIFYLENMIFILDQETGVTKAIDMGTGTLVYVIPPTKDYSTNQSQYIVEASGDILRVARSRERFDVCQLDTNKSDSPCWVKVTSVGDRALFIHYCDALTLRANDFAGIKRNSIYFYMSKNSSEEYEVKRMDIETGDLEHLPCSIKEPGYWYVPDLPHMLNM